MNPAIYFLSAALSATVMPSPTPAFDNATTTVTLFSLADLFPESKQILPGTRPAVNGEQVDLRVPASLQKQPELPTNGRSPEKNKLESMSPGNLGRSTE
jgi:hypothetical protein